MDQSNVVHNFIYVTNVNEWTATNAHVLVLETFFIAHLYRLDFMEGGIAQW